MDVIQTRSLARDLILDRRDGSSFPTSAALSGRTCKRRKPANSTPVAAHSRDFELSLGSVYPTCVASRGPELASSWILCLVVRIFGRAN